VIVEVHRDHIPKKRLIVGSAWRLTLKPVNRRSIGSITAVSRPGPSHKAVEFELVGPSVPRKLADRAATG
jgi:hypothetical protein